MRNSGAGFAPGEADVGCKMIKGKYILAVGGLILIGILPFRPDEVSYTSVDQIEHHLRQRLSIPKQEWFFVKSPGYILFDSPLGKKQVCLETERERFSLARLITGKWINTEWPDARIREFKDTHPELSTYWKQ